jgi:putative glutathione S-transferase
LAPPELVPAIDAANAMIRRDINNGAYKALARLDRLLEDQPWIWGDQVTEADVRLFPTIFRFDPVYYLRMKLNQAMVRDYRHLSRWLDDFSALPGVAEASNLEHCRLGYFGRTGDNLIPVGPQ